MNTKQIYELQMGDKVEHQLYGTCTVEGVVRGYGPLLLPDTMAGRKLQSHHSRMPSGTPAVEPLFHLLACNAPLPAVIQFGKPNPLTGTFPGF